jgi:hypothetical protein
VVEEATHHEEAEVVGVDGCETINHMTCLIVVIERLPKEIDIVTEGLTRALSEHEVVHQG